MAGTFAFAPIFFSKKHEHAPLTTSNKALSGNQIMRGAYSNYGSQDVGPDPEWVNGRYVGKSVTSFNPSEEEIAAHRAEMAARKAAAAAAAGAAKAGAGAAKVE